MMSFMTNLKPATAVLLATVLQIAGVSRRVAQAQPATDAVELSSETFAQFHKQIGPQPGESRWTDVPWLTDLHQARQKAAAEGKPIFLMVSGKGISIGMC